MWTFRQYKYVIWKKFQEKICSGRNSSTKLEDCRIRTLSAHPVEAPHGFPVGWSRCIRKTGNQGKKASRIPGNVFLFFSVQEGERSDREGLREGFPPCGFWLNFKRLRFSYIYIIKIVSNVYTFRVGESFIFKAFRAWENTYLQWKNTYLQLIKHIFTVSLILKNTYLQ